MSVTWPQNWRGPLQNGLLPSSPSTLGEPRHTDGRLRHALPPRDDRLGVPLVHRPRLIFTFDAKNPLRVCSWRARACIETEAIDVGGGV